MASSRAVFVINSRRSYSSSSNIVERIQKLINPHKVKVSDSQVLPFAKDEGHFRRSKPLAVICPTSIDEVSAILRMCNEMRVPVVPFGTGTGLEGGCIPSTDGWITVSLTELEGNVINVNEDDFDCTVRPSVTRKSLNEHIRNTGLFFPVDPGADASLCGMVATGASGTNAVRYGTMKENVLNLEVVLADGTVIDTRGSGRRPRKSAAGYNLTELFVGSEGTLGLITSATLRLHPRPGATGAAIAAFPSVRAAVTTVVQTMQSCIPIARIEILDDCQISASNAYSKITLPVAPTLFMEFHGATDDEVRAQVKIVEDISSSNEAVSFTMSADESEMQNLWTARHAAYYAALGLRKGCTGFTTDVCVPISKLPLVIVQTKEDLKKHGIIGTIVGHVGDGNFHVIMPVNEDDAQEMANINAFSDRLVKRALAANGTCTGEHGIGIGKMKYLEMEMGKALNPMRAIKKALDPMNILNPGKFFTL